MDATFAERKATMILSQPRSEGTQWPLRIGRLTKLKVAKRALNDDQSRKADSNIVVRI